MVVDKADVLIFLVVEVLEDTAAKAAQEGHMAIVVELMVQVVVAVAVIGFSPRNIWVRVVEVLDFLGKDLMGPRAREIVM
jgi:hypothetical protein